MSNNVCQSCGMIMKESERGTNLDGSIIISDNHFYRLAHT